MDIDSRLGSWKEIASYLGCSTRTARRWESAEGMPVHRHLHGSASTVYAFSLELDSWRDSRREEVAGARDSDGWPEEGTRGSGPKPLPNDALQPWTIKGAAALAVSAAVVIALVAMVGEENLATAEELLEVEALSPGEISDLLKGKKEVGTVLEPSQPHEGEPGYRYVALYTSELELRYGPLETTDYERAAHRWVWGFFEGSNALCRGPSVDDSACWIIKRVKGRYYAVGVRSGTVRYWFRILEG